MTISKDQPAAAASAFKESFEAFYAREVKSVTGLAYVLLGTRSGAEDLAHDGFVAAYRHWDKVGTYDDPGGWVRRVVANRAVSGFRRRSAELRALARLGSPQAYYPEVPAESEQLWREVRRLPRRQRQVIALRYVDGRGIEEIARILECSENTVKTHLLRAKRNLADRLRSEEERA